MLAAALSIKHLSKHYDKIPVVDDISLEIKQGEIFGLLGPNGAGKSTTINIVTGVAKLEGGSVTIFGHDNQSEFRLTRRLVGVMHQEVVYDPFFKMGRALKIHSGYYGVSDDPKWRELLIDRLGLGPHLHKRMNTLSGGMKRRFMVAKALVHKPTLLILDEPTAGVDVELRRALWDFVRQMNADGTTVLLTTHYLEEAEQMCERVAIMNEGKIVAMDRTQSLMRRVGKKMLLVRFHEPIKLIPDSLGEFKPRSLNDGYELCFCLSPDMDSGTIIRKIYEEGLPISEVESKAATLEDAFLNLTGTRISERKGP